MLVPVPVGNICLVSVTDTGTVASIAGVGIGTGDSGYKINTLENSYISPKYYRHVVYNKNKYFKDERFLFMLEATCYLIEPKKIES